VKACDDCLRRTALIAALDGWIDIQWRKRDATGRILALPDEVLLRLADRPEVWVLHDSFDAAAARERIARAAQAAVCRHEPGYPQLLLELPDPPAVLHVRGDARALGVQDGVAIVGARRATEYGLDVARGLGRDLTVAGVAVISGLAIGVDAASHAGALDAFERGGGGGAGGAVPAAAPAAAPVAVLAGGADLPYPRSSRWLYDRIAERGAIVSEMPPGQGIRRWGFPARNRIIAGLARATIVVEAAERSGSLITADLATDIGRAVGAVPGRVTTPVASGSNALLASGAAVIRGARDVLDLLAAHGFEHALPPEDPLPEEPGLRALLEAIDAGRSTVAALVRAPEETSAILGGLAELEARGLVRRAFGGRYVRAA